MFNAVYQLKNADVVYSDCLEVRHRFQTFEKGWSKPYPKYAI